MFTFHQRILISINAVSWVIDNQGVICNIVIGILTILPIQK